MTDPLPKCLPGLHETVAEKFAELVPAGSVILDIAAGEGAFTRRLTSMGYQVLANDIDSSNWKLPNVQLSQVNLNEPFAERFLGKDIRAIAAIEIIEHLENPRAFLRECRKIVPDGGCLVVTTPNVSSAVSRRIFLSHGQTSFFTPAQCVDFGHITILPWWMLHRHALSAQWNVVDTSFAGILMPSWKGRLAASLVNLVARYHSPDEKRFGCTLMVLRNGPENPGRNGRIGRLTASAAPEVVSP